MISMPFDRAFGGSKVKKRRAGLAQVEKGLNLAVTSVMNLVIIVTTRTQAREEQCERETRVSCAVVGRSATTIAKISGDLLLVLGRCICI